MALVEESPMSEKVTTRPSWRTTSGTHRGREPAHAAGTASTAGALVDARLRNRNQTGLRSARDQRAHEVRMEERDIPNREDTPWLSGTPQAPVEGGTLGGGDSKRRRPVPPQAMEEGREIQKGHWWATTEGGGEPERGGNVTPRQ